MAELHRRALVVDDDAGVRDVIADALRLEGIEVSTARGAAEAFAALEAGWGPSVILLDLQMPGLSGERLLPRLRAHPAAGGVAVIAMSASPDRLARVEGSDALLPKPFDLDTLLGMVWRLSDRSESEALAFGIQAIDADHEQQLDLARALAEALAEGRDGPEAARLIEQLADCTRDHFSREAGLMRSHGYPAIAEHLREHTRCVSELERWSEAPGTGASLPTSGNAMAFRDSIVHHIETMDRDFARFLSTRGAA